MSNKPGTFGYVADEEWSINTLDENALRTRLAEYEAELIDLARPGKHGDRKVDARRREDVLARRIRWIEHWIATLPAILAVVGALGIQTHEGEYV